jgi:hypothetical protein
MAEYCDGPDAPGAAGLAGGTPHQWGFDPPSQRGSSTVSAVLMCVAVELQPPTVRADIGSVISLARAVVHEGQALGHLIGANLAWQESSGSQRGRAIVDRAPALHGLRVGES